MTSPARDTQAARDAETVRPAIELNAGIYAVAALLSSGWIGLTLLDAGRDWTALVLGFLVVVMLLTRMWLVGPIYFATLAFLFRDEERAIRTVGEFSGQESLLAAASIVFLISSCRYLCLTAPVLPYSLLSITETVRESLGFLMSVFTGGPEDNLTKKARLNSRMEERSAKTVRAEEFMTCLLRILLALLAAFLLLQYVPLRDGYESRKEFGLVATGLRSATLAWILVGVTLVLSVVLTPISWVRHSSREAGVYLRSVVTRWCFKDLRSMGGRLVKTRRESVVTRLRRGGKPARVSLFDAEGTVVKAESHSVSAVLQQRKDGR